MKPHRELEPPDHTSSFEYKTLFEAYLEALAQAEKLEAALVNCRMQFADMMSRRKAPDAWMIQELDEALLEFEKWKDGK